MKTKKTLVKLVKLIFLIAGGILIVFFLFQLLRGDFFKINQVICFDNLDKVTPCQADWWFKVNGLVLGKNIILLSPPKTEQLIKNELPGIDQVEVKKKLPDKLIVYLTKRKPIAVIETNSDYYQVDYQGIILAKLDQPTDLPLVVGDEIELSDDKQKIKSSQILACLKFLYQLMFENIEVQRIKVTNSQESTFNLKTGAEVLINLEKDWQRQVDSLQLILKRAKIEGKQIKVIDLRFDKPVIYAD